MEGLAPMTYFKSTEAGPWRSYRDGENATAECLQQDECSWEIAGYLTVRDATREAERHVLETGHPVEVERSQFRVISKAER